MNVQTNAGIKDFHNLDYTVFRRPGRADDSLAVIIRKHQQWIQQILGSHSFVILKVRRKEEELLT